MRETWVKEAGDDIGIENPEEVMEKVKLIFEEALKNQ